MNMCTSHGEDSGTVLCCHSVQAQILHFTNAQPQFWPDWASSGPCSYTLMLSCFTYTAVVDIGLQLLGRSVADGHMHMFYLPVDTVRSPTTHKPSEHEVHSRTQFER